MYHTFFSFFIFFIVCMQLMFTQTFASSSPFKFSLTPEGEAPLSAEINDFQTLKNIYENSGKISNDELAQMISTSKAQIQKMVDDDVFSQDFTAQTWMYGHQVVAIARKGDIVTIIAPDLNINESFDISAEGLKDMGEALSKKMLQGDVATKLYSGLLTICQKAPVSPLAGNPTSALSTMIGLTSSMALIAKEKITGWVVPFSSSSAHIRTLKVANQELDSQALTRPFSTLIFTGEYSQLNDGDFTSKSLYFPIGYVANVSWLRGMKWVSDFAYRSTTVENSFIPTTMQVLVVGTGFSIPFGNLSIMPHVSLGGGVSKQIVNAGTLWETSLTATYDVPINCTNLTFLGLIGYGASFTVDSFIFEGFTLDPKLSSPHFKLGANYFFPLNEHLFMELLASHTQFLEGSELYVTRTEEFGIKAGLTPDLDTSWGIKGGVSYLTSDHHDGFMFNLTMVF